MQRRFYEIEGHLREAHFSQKLFNIACAADIDAVSNQRLLLGIWVRLTNVAQMPTEHHMHRLMFLIE